VVAKVLLQKQMTSEALEIEFQDAVDRVNAYTEPFPADVLLKLYAYYKKATNNYSRPSSKKAIINAFKTNALFQVKNISEDEAKRLYIDLVNNYFLYGK
jgi:acyl-CoA-binding protein